MSENPQPTIEDLAAASIAADGKIPQTVIEAFLPKPSSLLGQRLVPITAGHELLLAQLQHPLASGKPWEDIDVLTALFVFSRPSRDLFFLIADDTFEAVFFEFIDGIPPADIGKLGQDLIAHWLRSRASALAMENKHSTAQKKTAVLDGGSTLSARLARSTAGFLKRLSTMFR